MISLNDQCIDTIQRHPDVYINFSEVESIIKETISTLNQDTREFLAFAYELRKQDYDNSHTKLLLTDNVRPTILSDIVLANYWDPATGTMRCDPNKTFKILIGDNNPLVYHKNPGKNLTERPQIKRSGVDRRKYMEDLHLVITEQGGLQIFTSNMNCLLSTKAQMQQGSDVEGEDETVAWLSSQGMTGTHGSNLHHSWQLMFTSHDCGEPLFFLQACGGDKPQKLTVNKENPKNSSDLALSSRNQDISADFQRMVWKIMSYEN